MSRLNSVEEALRMFSRLEKYFNGCVVRESFILSWTHDQARCNLYTPPTLESIGNKNVDSFTFKKQDNVQWIHLLSIVTFHLVNELPTCGNGYCALIFSVRLKCKDSVPKL